MCVYMTSKFKKEYIFFNISILFYAADHELCLRRFAQTIEF
jgi:hypothetical protein